MKEWLVIEDLGYFRESEDNHHPVPGGRLVFSSGPTRRKQFRHQQKALAFIARSPHHCTLYRHTWSMVEGTESAT